ncbi:lipoprotein [Amphibacillus jilinensis]|uniref:LptM family lipoprotein n=1 Tax=Amphibacillus jilinensis TaxID=1216008 RepID=UPI0002FAB58B|nr:DUF4352 domain-containing protein [Amphibacillus jilinensis]
MKKMLYLLILMMVTLLVTACGNNSPEEEVDQNEINQGESSSDEIDTDGDDNASTSDEDTSSSDPSTSDELLSLGETGVLQTIVGDFEATPTAVRFVEEVDERKPSNDIFVIVDMTISNIGDETIPSEDLLHPRLHNVRGGGIAPSVTFDSIENFEDDIHPGEEVSGQFLFNYSVEDTYELSIGETALSSMSNAVRWRFEAEEIE